MPSASSFNVISEVYYLNIYSDGLMIMEGEKNFIFTFGYLDTYQFSKYNLAIFSNSELLLTSLIFKISSVNELKNTLATGCSKAFNNVQCSSNVRILLILFCLAIY